MLEGVKAFIVAHPFVAALLSGLWGALAVDLMAFLKWQSWDEYAKWNWRLTLLRAAQGAIGNIIGTLAVAGGTAAVSLALYWLW